MSRYLLRTTIVIAILVPRNAFAEDTKLLARKMLQANRDYQASIVSLEVQFKQAAPGFPHMRQRPDCLFTWVKSGSQEVVYTDPEYAYGKKWRRLWQAWSGKEAITASYFSFDTNCVAEVVYEKAFPDSFFSFVAFPVALGWRFPPARGSSLQGQSLVSLMQNADHSQIVSEVATVVVGEDRELEFPAVKWPLCRVPAPPGADASECEVTVWFDPANNWLPRKWTLYPVGWAPGQPLSKGTIPRSYAVIEFMSVPDPLLKRDRRFPKSIVSGTVDTVVSIRINEAIPQGVFEPDVSVGTKIVRNPRSRKPSKTFVGGEEGAKLNLKLHEQEMRFRYPERSTTENATQSAIDRVAVDASAVPRTEWFSVVVLSLSVLALPAAVVLRFRTST